jgi:hypothetical protein
MWSDVQYIMDTYPNEIVIVFLTVAIVSGISLAFGGRKGKAVSRRTELESMVGSAVIDAIDKLKLEGKITHRERQAMLDKISIALNLPRLKTREKVEALKVKIRQRLGISKTEVQPAAKREVLPTRLQVLKSTWIKR